MKDRKNYGFPPRFKDLRVEQTRSGGWSVVGYDTLAKYEYELHSFNQFGDFGKLLAEAQICNLVNSGRGLRRVR